MATANELYLRRSDATLVHRTSQNPSKKLRRFHRHGTFRRAIAAVTAVVVLASCGGSGDPEEPPDPWRGTSLVTVVCGIIAAGGSATALTSTQSSISTAGTPPTDGSPNCVRLPRPVLVPFPPLPVVVNNEPHGHDLLEIGLVGCMDKPNGPVLRLGFAESAPLNMTGVEPQSVRTPTSDKQETWRHPGNRRLGQIRVRFQHQADVH